MTKHIFFSLLVIAFHMTSAQNEWGGITPANLQLQSYQEFPDADAVILLKSGHLTPQEGQQGYEFAKTFYLRIHILTEKGLENADQAIYYYSKDNHERVGKYRARTVNLENGELSFSTLKKKDFFKDDDLTTNYSALKFTFPNVKPGSILEFEYTVYKKSIFSDIWYFQGDLPTITSTFAFIPHNKMSHVFLFQGLFDDRLQNFAAGAWIMNNIPELKEEPFVSNLDDFRAKMLIQLDAYVSNGITKKTLNSWEDLTKEMYQENSFGKLNKKNMDLDDEVGLIVNRNEEPEEKLKRIYKYITENIEWDGTRRIFTEDDLDKIMEEKKGSSAQINLVLTRMLRQAEITAYPLLLSTRKHGVIIKAYPLLVQFNTLACYAEIDGKPYILDATDPNRAYDLPDIDLLNDEGWLLDEENPRWIRVPRNYPSDDNTVAWLKMEEDGNLSGSVSSIFGGYAAVENRDAIQESEDDFWEKHIKKHIPEGEISEMKIVNADDPYSNLTAKAEIKTSDFSNVAGDFIYLKPMLMFGIENNPFKATQRYYPVDFVHEHQSQTNLTFIIPEEYEVESLPKSARLGLADGGMSFIYQCERVYGTPGMDMTRHRAARRIWFSAMSGP